MAEKLTEMDCDGRPRWTVEGAHLIRCNSWDVIVDVAVPLLPVGGSISDGAESSGDESGDRTDRGVYTTPVNVREVHGGGGGGGGGGDGGDEFPDAMEETHAFSSGGAHWPTVAACGVEAAESMTDEERARSCQLFSRPRRGANSLVSFSDDDDDDDDHLTLDYRCLPLSTLQPRSRYCK